VAPGANGYNDQERRGAAAGTDRRAIAATPPAILRLWITVLLAVLMAAFFARQNAWVRRCKMILPLLLLIVGGMVMGGCASGGQNVPAQGTPRGTSTITVTATSGSLMHTTKLTLTVH
jgi:hypothetical protein